MRTSFHLKGAQLIALFLLTGVVTGCGLREAANDAVDSAQQAAKGVSAEAASATVGAAVEQSLQEAGYSVSAPPDCTADLQASGVRLGLGGEVVCAGELSTGSPYEAVFRGEITLNGRCPGSLTVDITGERPVTLTKIDVCRAAQILEGG